MIRIILKILSSNRINILSTQRCGNSSLYEDSTKNMLIKGLPKHHAIKYQASQSEPPEKKVNKQPQFWKQEN